MDLSKRLSVPMNQLFRDEPALFESIIRSRAIPFVNAERQHYYHSLYNTSGTMPAKERTVLLGIAKANFDEYAKTFRLLKECVKDTSIPISAMCPVFDKDFQKIQKGKLQVEIGPYSYHEVKQIPGENSYLKLPLKQFQQIDKACNNKTFSFKQPFAAFLKKGSPVSLTVKTAHLPAFQQAVAKLNTKQQSVERSNDLELQKSVE